MYKKSFHVAKVQLNTDLFPQDDYKKKKKEREKATQEPNSS